MIVHFSGEDRQTAKLRNIAHSIVLVGGIGLITGLCAYVLWGQAGLFWTVIAVAAVVMIGPRIAPEALMRMFNARLLDERGGGHILSILRQLAQRAGLPAVPKLYILPSPVLNAFATGSRASSVIAISEGLLQRLTLRELTGVLAHEISHIRNNDLWVMSLADIMSRFTRIMSLFGVILFFFTLPLALMGVAHIPWLVILLLYFAPTLANLLQLALSRAREYDADLHGADISGDPAGLASALEKIERYQGRVWEDMFLPGRRIPQPSVLRTHPPTDKRIERLQAIKKPQFRPLALPQPAAPPSFGITPAFPHFRWTGFWF